MLFGRGGFGSRSRCGHYVFFEDEGVGLFLVAHEVKVRVKSPERVGR